MALTKKQVEGVTDLFVINFVNSNDELDRKKILIQFEDAFGKSICEWKNICREKIELCTSDKRIIECYDEILTRVNKQIQLMNMSYGCWKKLIWNR